MTRDRRRSRRERVLFRLPSALLEYPFEVFISAAGIVLGASALTGVVQPSSLEQLLPALGMDAWAAGLLLGALTVCAGLTWHITSAVTAGLRLLAFLFAAYGVAVVGYADFSRAGVVFILFVVIAVLAAFRSFLLTTLDDVGRRIQKES